MSNSSWKQAATSKFSSLKTYIAQQTPPELKERAGDWKEKAGNLRGWAEQKLNAKDNAGSSNGNISEVKVWLFPGWATRRNSRKVEIYVSGFSLGTTADSRAQQSRSQRAFTKLAKSFAGLPRLDLIDQESDFDKAVKPLQPPSRSTENLLHSVHLPPRPSDISDDYTDDEYEEELTQLERELDAQSIGSTNDDLSTSSIASLPSLDSRPNHYSISPNSQSRLLKLHTNLENRLRPFWGSALGGRVVRVSLWHSDSAASASMLSTKEVLTSPVDGSFQVRFIIDDTFQDHSNEEREVEFKVVAELLPQPQMQQRDPFAARLPPPSSPSFSSSRLAITLPRINLPTPLRVISDIDDTVKHTNVPGGARVAFYNAFVEDLDKVVIPGMGEWYREMDQRGVRFEYVSNSPYQLLPVIQEFLELAKLPRGSLKLRSYTSKSLFAGLFSGLYSWSSPFAAMSGTAEPANAGDANKAEEELVEASDPGRKKGTNGSANDWATRKRAGIVENLEAFPESRFIFVGDSGEGDLEVYTELARERSTQILAIFIRDVSMDNPIGVEPLDDPTGANSGSFRARVGIRSGSTPVPGGLRAASLDLDISLEQDLPTFRLPPPRSAPPTLDDSELAPPHPPFASNDSGGRSSRLNTPSSSRGNLAPLSTVYSSRTSPPKQNTQSTIKSTSTDYFTSTSTTSSSSTIKPSSNANNGRTFGAKPLTTEPEPIPTPTYSPYTPRTPRTPYSSATPITPGSPRTPWSHSNSSLSSLKSFKTSSSLSTLGARIGITAESDSQRQQRELQRQERGRDKRALAALRRRDELQSRVYAARSVLPPHIILRVFRDPRECYEDTEICFGKCFD